jgi:brefeldin A-inhibited guanine nucleotide-exchange protein
VSPYSRGANYHRVLNVLSKITLTPVHLTGAQAAEHQAAIQAAQAAYNAHASTSTPTLSPTPSQTSFPRPQSPVSTSPPPSNPVESSQGNSGHAPTHSISTSSEYNLKVQSLQTLVMVLRSLVTWSQQGIAATIGSTAPQDDTLAHTPPDDSPRALTPNPGPGGRSTSQSEIPNRAYLVDDPEQFEALKYRKTALQDAIRKFNFKPKKVVDPSIFADCRDLRRFFEVVSSSRRSRPILPSFYWPLRV